MDFRDSYLGETNPLIVRNRLGRNVSRKENINTVDLTNGEAELGQAESSNNNPNNIEPINPPLDVSNDNVSSSKNYEEVIYDIVSSILSKMFQFLTIVYETSQKVYIKHKERNVKERNDLAIEERSGDIYIEGHNEKSDTEESVVIVDVKNKPSNNVFEPLLQFEEEEEEEANGNETQQYGTSLSIAKYPKFSSSSSYTPTGLNGYSLFMTTKPDVSNLDILEPTKTTDYDSYVSKFYLPHEPVSKNKYSLVDTLIDNFFIDGISDIFKERKERQKLISKERESLKTRLLPLSKEDQQLVTKFWNQPPGSVVTSAFQIEITTRDLQTLCDGHWLNDNVIDFYFNLITSKNQSVFGWTTHFFTTLKLKGYQGVARWSKRKKVNVTEKDLILVPINIMGTHWALAVVNNKEKRFQYFDSLSSNGNQQALQIIKNYMIQEGKKHNSSIDFEKYSIMKNMPSPQQQNGFDCGVFACICAKYVAQWRDLTYRQKDMKLIRRRMAYEIITKDLLD
ncbi:uncharacterized protein AC631_00263 [Debaryomyces fabryi]|uniref:Ubiquitin-like protease family profile domain-containing protein n=1 Tax=Debaryomyces fabryi TaxID=58627 RepID=A0A0V1Q6D1_9ASCO|nr:uncharacterized protein AC631_00263 [Debaryomyces fabryi]KSA03993.1 hypothetical protein AC631_00263 [Debaryomyces fabryi]CUM53770.1 unnamed protein product [Debaryomyces fabryi]